MGSGRRYNAPKRAQAAERTREAVASAAASLFSEKGFDKTTIAEIAVAAGVSAPTVYAVFGSKAGLVKELLREARFSLDYQAALERAHSADDPAERLRRTASVAREAYGGEHRLLDLWRAADLLSPVLSAVVSDSEEARREGQAKLIDFISESGRLKPGLDREAARDILWALTSREMYRLLVLSRNWSPDQYEQGLGGLLTTALLVEPA